MPTMGGIESRCPDRHVTIAAALTACHHEGKQSCAGVTMLGGAERKRDRKRCGAAIYIRSPGRLSPYEGKWEGSRSWVPLSGADAEPCTRLTRLVDAPRAAAHIEAAASGSATANASADEHPDPSAPPPPPLPASLKPVPSGWEPSRLLGAGASPRHRSRIKLHREELAARHHREMSLAVVAASGAEGSLLSPPPTRSPTSPPSTHPSGGRFDTSRERRP